jgi:GTP diphosphokinase / guanosine-3',5'-bis(diphosphate) 3'-diphosphatase
MISTTMTGFVPKLTQMIMLATEAHANQFDKGGQPYVLHPMRVMLSMPPQDEIGRIVGMGHDLVEDTEVTVEQIRHIFGDVVADAIDALSRRETPFACDKLGCEVLHSPVRENYMQFIERITQNEVACRVKLMDIADNMRPERWHASITGLGGRYAKARDFLTAAILEYQTRETLDFLVHAQIIDADEQMKRLRKLIDEA